MHAYLHTHTLSLKSNRMDTHIKSRNLTLKKKKNFTDTPPSTPPSPPRPSNPPTAPSPQPNSSPTSGEIPQPRKKTSNTISNTAQIYTFSSQ